MHVTQINRGRMRRVVVDGLERRTLFAVTVTEIALADPPRAGVHAPTAVAVDAAGDVYATRYFGGYPFKAELVRLRGGTGSPELLASLEPLSVDTADAPHNKQAAVGRLSVDAAGNVFGLTSLYDTGFGDDAPARACCGSGRPARRPCGPCTTSTCR